MSFPNPRSDAATGATVNFIERLLIDPRGRGPQTAPALQRQELDDSPSYPSNNPRKSDVLGVMDGRVGRMGAGETLKSLVPPGGTATDVIYTDVLFNNTTLENAWDALPDAGGGTTGTNKFTADLAYPAGFTRVHSKFEGAMWDMKSAAENSIGQFDAGL